jgi:hypothetical protein
LWPGESRESGRVSQRTFPQQLSQISGETSVQLSEKYRNHGIPNPLVDALSNPALSHRTEFRLVFALVEIG